MKLFRFFWICSNLALLASCTGFSTKPFSLSGEKSDIMAGYCQSGKQIKPFKTTVLYFSPKIEPGLSLDKAGQKLKKSEDQKAKILKELFYLLANPDGKEQVVNAGDEPKWYLLSSNDENDVLDNVKAENSSTKYPLFTFIVKVPNKIIVYQSNLSSRRMNYDKTYSTDLHNLISDHTILAPKEIIEKMVGSEFDGDHLYSTIILDKDGQVDISKAVERRDDLWKRYIQAFTSVKESVDQNSQKSTIELSLNLNIFCKYGRHLSDVQSQ